ncbi:SDR family oxidoreductase [Dawidia soli]|uniref:SDR family oxidoreductase n=1 Tax=Dawidia soli TaxID=2782352 RepID=A0AAP2GJ10_9BACT|nr:SDR family oxidoreductase [Dawidia soli]MBT1687995.1 SDR family oxidoreductase [Dawidia soli]
MSTSDKQANRFTLAGKRVIILGGSAGIGLAVARAAAAEGAVVVIGSSNPQRVDDALKTLPATATGYTVDLSAEEAIKDFFATMGPFDHLVYTAGENLRLSNISETDVAFARNYFTIRYWGAFLSIKYGAPSLREGGAITLTSGVAAERPGKGWSLGTSICSAMEGFTRAMAVELAPIRVNIVSPGIVKTDLWSAMSTEDRESMYNATAHALPVKMVAGPEEIALTYLYLMKQPYTTGQTVVVDGGWVLV